ncbi:MAG: PspA/IM30 family protein [Chloroflexia bacterium]|nr:PspA/IM30 family protein [Chloroflexia bacterium]
MASLLKRIRDLVSANLNAMLDKAEDPEKMVNEYLRQMQDQLYETRTAVAAAMADENKLHRLWTSNQAMADEWESKATAALQAEKEDLAKQALIRRRGYLQLAESYQKQYESQDQQVEELRDALAKLEAKIAEAKARRELIIAKKHQAETQEAIVATVRTLGDSTTAFEGLGRMEEKVNDRLAQAQAMAELEGGALEIQMEDVEADTAAEADLAELKKKLGME